MIFSDREFFYVSGITVNDIYHLRGRNIAVVGTVTPDMLGNIWQEVEYRLDLCKATNGSHVEIY